MVVFADVMVLEETFSLVCWLVGDVVGDEDVDVVVVVVVDAGFRSWRRVVEMGPLPLVSELNDAIELRDESELSDDELGDLDSPKPESRGSTASAAPGMSSGDKDAFCVSSVERSEVEVAEVEVAAGSPVTVVDERATMSLSAGWSDAVVLAGVEEEELGWEEV